MLTNTQIASILQQHSANTSITVAQICAALANVSVTFASIVSVTKVVTSAAHKSVKIVKITSANVQLYANVNAASAVYTKAVKRSAANISANNAQNVNTFVASAPSYTHNTNCYSIVHNANTNNTMLYARYLKSKSVYVIVNANNTFTVVTKQQVAAYLTASAASKLLDQSTTITNKTNNVQHNVRIATPSINNIVALTIRKQLLLK
jgi:hypothetical protein